MKIFITGGTGFLGQHVVQQLQGRHQLLILSRNPKHNFLKGDLADIPVWKNQLADFKPQAALHLAWEGIPDYNIENSLKNLRQSVALFNLLAELKCKKIVVAGSCWEYGALSGKLNEETGLRSHNAFTAAKNAVHGFGLHLAKNNNLDFTWTRLFYVYGPGQKSSSLIPYLIQSSQKGIYPELKNPDGGNDFVFVEDVARALKMILENKFNATGTRIYNIGSGKLVGVREIANQIFSRKKIKAKKPTGFYADISKIKKEIGWKPEIAIKSGIQKTIDYFKNIV